jgi:TRAP transporter 4TM/12TM fusion protein
LSDHMPVIKRTESRFRNLFTKEQILVSITAILYSAFILYTSMFGFFPNLIQRSAFVGFALVLAYLTNPHFLKRSAGKSIGWFGYVCVVFSIITTAWVIFNYDRFMTQSTYSSAIDMLFASILICLLLESARRTMGSIFVILTVIAILYAFVGPWLPGDFAHRGFSFEYIVQHLYISSYGMWGTTTGVMVGMVSIFIILGTILSETGGAKVFISIATALGGKSVGGPAKVAVIGSSLFGMVSGSASANGAVIGAMTIPMMKKSGYSSEFSAATEAVAGTGGQIMPPVMGAGAFLIAEKLGVPYIDVAIAAAIPAIIYYVGVFAAVHFISLKLKMKGLSSDEIKEYIKELSFKKIVLLFVPLGLLIGFLVRGYTVALAGVYSISVAVLLYLFSDLNLKELPNRLKGIVISLSDAGKGLVMLGLLGACADIIIGMLSLTGLGVEISAAIFNLSHGILIVGLFLAMVTTLILGMGLPTTAAYILASSVVLPAMSNFDMNPMAANIFLFYFACISAFTPPVCVAIYITSGIAEANWVKAGITACKIGAAAFLVPYMAVFQNSLIMQGDPLTIIISSLIAVCGAAMLAGSMMNNFFYDLNIVLRVILFVASILTLYPGYISSGAGIALGAAVFLMARSMNFKKSRMA